MIKQRKIQIFLALSIATVFFFQCCATLIPKSSETIPVTSHPPGAKIIIDGKEIGHTPLNLKLRRNKNHVIRIEKQGYKPYEIRITKNVSTGLVIISLLGGAISGACLGAFIGFVSKYYSDFSVFSIFVFPLAFVELIGGRINKDEVDTWIVWIWAGILAGTGLEMLSGFLSGNVYKLSPKELKVTLTKTDEKSQFDIIQIDSSQFQNVKWIRIGCANSDDEQIINLD
jgi:hypothetical protein